MWLIQLFFASLRESTNKQDNEVISRSDKTANRPSEGISDVQSLKDIEISRHFNSEDLNERIVFVEKFFQRIIGVIKNNSQLFAGIEHFIKGYEKSESLSMRKLASYLFQQNSSSQSMDIRSGSKIKVQSASIQRRKSHVQKENIDPTEMKARKKRTISKKAHKLSKT
ncbi:9320_t:CDS:2, partial [Gigaspora margarita]